jgi:outer membrane immunogenic protein
MNRLFLAVSALGLFAAVPAFAQESPQTGVYLNLGYNHVFADVDDDDDLFDDDDTSLGAIQGRLGYRFHPNFAVEGEAATGIKSGDLEVAPGTDAKVKLKSQMAIYGVGLLPLSDRFDLFGRVGYGTQDIKVKALGVSASDDVESVNYGVGAQYSFDGMNGIRGEYTKYDFQDGGGSVDSLSLSYVRKF